MQDNLTDSKKSSGIKRRTVVAGAAWSVPAILVAGAAPAMAATPIVTIGVGLACKHPGAGNGKHYHFELTVTNNGGDPTTVTITEIVLVPTSGQTVTFSTLPAPFSVGAHSSECVVVDSDLTANSSNGTLMVSYSFIDSNGDTQTVTAAIDVGSLPPCSTLGVPDFPHAGYTC